MNNNFCNGVLNLDVYYLYIVGSFDTILSFSDISTDVQTRVPVRRWNTGFMTQLKMLTWRNFKQSRGKFLHFQDIIFYVFMSTVASVLFFQIKQNEDSVRDRMGLVSI